MSIDDRISSLAAAVGVRRADAAEGARIEVARLWLDRKTLKLIGETIGGERFELSTFDSLEREFADVEKLLRDHDEDGKK